MDTDSFLMALRRFIARRGTPAELFSDQGTNFRGEVERELHEAFGSKDRVYTRPVAKLVVLPALPPGEDEDNATPSTP